MFSLRAKFRSIRWLLAELVVVVLGILIAFQIDEWGTQRENRRQEIIGLQAISDDLEIGAEEFRAYKKLADRNYDQIVRLLELLQDHHDHDSERIILTTELPPDRLWRPTSTAFDSLRDSGNLNLISDGELRSALVKYFDTFEPYFLDYRLYTSDARKRYLEVLKKDFDVVPDPNFRENQSTSRKLTISPEDWPSDPEFRDELIVFARYIHTASNLSAVGLARAVELQSRIAAHIETLR